MTSSTHCEIAIIGGSGFYDFFEGKIKQQYVETPFGKTPRIEIGEISGRNVAFLPIYPGPVFDVEVKSGTALVLPVVTYLGFPEDDPLPNDWFGDRDHVFGDVYLDGEPIVEPNEAYYVGPTYLDPYVVLFDIYEIAFYQAIVCVINPLPPGEHVIVLHSEFVDFGDVFDNTWNITVVPGKK